MLPIVILPSATLRTKSQAIKKTGLSQSAFLELLQELPKTMCQAKGIGIAAPQVGISETLYRTLVGDSLPDPAILQGKTEQGQQSYGLNIALCVISKEALPKGQKKETDLILMNPRYERIGKKTMIEDEACLSVPGAFGPVKRWKDIRVSALLPNGESITFEARQYFARVIQHEIDHLNGILFIDRAHHVEHHA